MLLSWSCLGFGSVSCSVFKSFINANCTKFSSPRWNLYRFDKTITVQMRSASAAITRSVAPRKKSITMHRPNVRKRRRSRERSLANAASTSLAICLPDILYICSHQSANRWGPVSRPPPRTDLYYSSCSLPTPATRQTSSICYRRRRLTYGPHLAVTNWRTYSE